jgi:hypothetical protein
LLAPQWAGYSPVARELNDVRTNHGTVKEQQSQRHQRPIGGSQGEQHHRRSDDDRDSRGRPMTLLLVLQDGATPDMIEMIDLSQHQASQNAQPQ